MRGVEQIPWLYDPLLWLLERTGLSRWRGWVAAGARGRTLDLGTGSGRNLPLLPAGALPVALDPSPENLRAARARAPGVPLVRARAEALPFRDGAFDTVTGGFVFCSVQDVPAAFAELARVLAPGGRLRLVEHVLHRRAAWARAQRLVQPAWTCLTGGCHPDRDTLAALRRAGFRPVEGSVRARGVMLRLEAEAPTSTATSPSTTIPTSTPTSTSPAKPTATAAAPPTAAAAAGTAPGDGAG